LLGFISEKVKQLRHGWADTYTSGSLVSGHRSTLSRSGSMGVREAAAVASRRTDSRESMSLASVSGAPKLLHVRLSRETRGACGTNRKNARKTLGFLFFAVSSSAMAKRGGGGKKGSNPLHEAVDSGDVARVKALISEPDALTKKNSDGSVVYHVLPLLPRYIAQQKMFLSFTCLYPM
jgi:hypothetical protein